MPDQSPGSAGRPRPPAERLVQVICRDERGAAVAAALEARGYAVRRLGVDVAAIGAEPARARVLVWDPGLGDAADCANRIRRADPWPPLVMALPAPLAAAWRGGADAVPDDDADGVAAAVDRVVGGGDLDVAPDALLDALEDAVAVVDAAGRVRWTNRAFRRLFHGADAVAPGRPIDALLPDLDAPFDERRGDGGWIATEAVGASGLRFGVDVRVARVGGARALVTVRDAAPRRLAELTERANTDLREQVQRTQRIGALGRLAGGLAHDFNNVLQLIDGYAETLGGERLDPAGRRRLLGRIKGATDRAASLTRQLLTFGRRQVLVPEVLDLNETVQSLHHLLQRVIGEDIHMGTVLAADLARVHVDPGQIEQVLLNLVLNARDAMPHGGVLDIASANVTLRAPWTPAGLPAAVPPGRWVLVTVRDTGTGMDGDTVAQAFEPFFTTKDPNRGSGLGLSMVYGIVKQSGGYTWIESTPGSGTSVHVLLPAYEDVGAQRDAPAAAPMPVQVRAPRPGTVLLVEDDPEVRALFATFLRQAGHTVIEAADGREALEVFDGRGGAVDLVVSDVVMPHVSGPSLVRALRARRASLKVVFLSGYNDPLGIAEADAHLRKPVTRAALLGQVADLLDEARHGDGHGDLAAQAAG